MNPDITYDSIFGPAWGAAAPAGLVSEFGSGVPMLTASPAAAAGATPALVGTVFGPGFFRSADFGLLLFGLALLYFDLRLINRDSGS